jgi:regulator of sirC expression with transglutaminase-like and TPR domain
MYLSQARLNFHREIRQSHTQIDLARAALYIAQEEYSGLDVESYRTQLDDLAASLRRTLPSERYPLRIVHAINDYLFDYCGFRGNEGNYYDPRNSFLNDTIDRRTGIPITLSLIYLEISRRVDFPMMGVNTPGHFLIRPDVPGIEIWIDPFNQGEILFREDCQERLSEMYGEAVEFTEVYFEAIHPRRFLARLLTNLKMIYLRQEDVLRALSAIERILLLFPNAPMELRDRGVLYYHQERWVEARTDLEHYLELMPTNQDAMLIKAILDAIG